jgi:hypothetical protein
VEWTILESDKTKQDPTGVEGFILRMDKELRDSGPPLEGFRFLNSGLEMLRITRDIEAEAQASGAGSTLYVGFQTAEKLVKEMKRYRQINQSGVQIVGFGQGDIPEEDTPVLEQWVDLPQNTRALENQWYLVATLPTPIVFIGWETSIPQMFGQGGISRPGKQFKGFVSGDQRVVDAVVAHLEKVRRQYGPTQAMSIERLADEIPFPIHRIMVLTDEGRTSQLKAMREDAAQLASKRSSSIILYDLSAASYLVSPYPSGEYQKEWRRALDKKELGIIGRQYLVEQLEDLEARRINGGAVLPTTHGFTHLAGWAERGKVDLIMIPSSLVRPGLIDRIKGYTLKTLLDSTNIPVLVYKEGGNVWLCTNASGIRAHAKGMTPAPHVSGPESFLSPVRGDNSPDVGEIHPLFP